MSYLHLAKIPVQAVTPEPQGIESGSFTDGYTRSKRPGKNGNSLFMNYLPLAKISVRAIIPEPYGIDLRNFKVEDIIPR